MSWRTELGPEFAVPDEITALVEEGILEDITDANRDVVPFFRRIFDDGSVIAVTVEHPRRYRRQEVGPGRYFVYWVNRSRNRIIGRMQFPRAAMATQAVLETVSRGTALEPPEKSRGKFRVDPEEWRP